MGASGWELWPDAVLASAGFPVNRLMSICDDELAAAAADRPGADVAAGARYRAAYAKAKERLSTVIQGTAADDRFREAVAWQALAPLTKHVDRALSGKLGGRGGRTAQQGIARLLQRYCMSNETLGFFGPVGWARVGQDNICVEVRPGPRPLSRRTTYFDSRPIDILATRIAARPEVLPWLMPRITPSAVLDRHVLRLPFYEPIALSAREANLLRRCDGTLPILMLAGDPPDPALVALLMRFRELGACEFGLDVPISTWPERELQARVVRIADPAIRTATLAPVAELVAAKATVGAAAGDAERLRQAIS